MVSAHSNFATAQYTLTYIYANRNKYVLYINYICYYTVNHYRLSYVRIYLCYWTFLCARVWGRVFVCKRARDVQNMSTLFCWVCNLFWPKLVTMRQIRRMCIMCKIYYTYVYKIVNVCRIKSLYADGGGVAINYHIMYFNHRPI